VIRITLAALGGFAAWWVAVTLLDLLLRLSWPEYAAVEKAMTFTLGMQIARLVEGAAASVAAGFTTALISRRKPIATWILVALLLALFIPVHYQFWERFPAWYHLVFIASLVVLPPLGAKLR